MRHHCARCDVEWTTTAGSPLAECWNCGGPGANGSLPDIEGLPGQWNSGYPQLASQAPADEPFPI